MNIFDLDAEQNLIPPVKSIFEGLKEKNNPLNDILNNFLYNPNRKFPCRIIEKYDAPSVKKSSNGTAVCMEVA